MTAAARKFEVLKGWQAGCAIAPLPVIAHPIAHPLRTLGGGSAITSSASIVDPIADPLRTLEKWLSVADLSALANIAEQNVRKAIARRSWRGSDLMVRQVEIGRGGAGGMAPQVHVDSLPPDLRTAWYLSQGIALHDRVDPGTEGGFVAHNRALRGMLDKASSIGSIMAGVGGSGSGAGPVPALASVAAASGAALQRGPVHFAPSYSMPITVGSGADLEAVRATVQRELMAAEARAKTELRRVLHD